MKRRKHTNITTLKGILGRKFAGANVDDIQGISDWSLFKEAAANFVNEINAAETVRHTTVEVFRDVYDYDPPDDVKAIVDIRPQTSTRGADDNPTRRFSEEFDQIKSSNQSDFSLEWVDAVRLLRYTRQVTGGNIGVHTMDSLTANGTWSGTAANIALSTNNPYKGSGSISADFDTGEYIENTGLTAVDLGDHKNKSTLFLAAYFPDASLVTSVELRWGSSSSAYFSRTRTAPQFGSSFRTGWNLIPFAWNGATETGTVDADNIDYLRITYNGSSDTDIKFDNIFSALGEVRTLPYYSTYLFRTSVSNWIETPNADSNDINLSTESENLFVYECIRLAALGLQGRGEIYQSYTDLLYGTPQQIGAYARYRERNPDEPIKPQSRWRRFGYTKK